MKVQEELGSIVQGSYLEGFEGTREESEEVTGEFGRGYAEGFKSTVTRENEIEDGSFGRVKVDEIFFGWAGDDVRKSVGSKSRREEAKRFRDSLARVM